MLAEMREEVPSEDVYPLLAHAIGKTREFILTYPQYVPSYQEVRKWEEYLKRRKRGEPMAYIIGKKEFYSLTFKVTPHTLIPRPETELLVEEIIRRRPESLLDIGTGAGNIAVAVKYHVRSIRVVATDVCEKTLRVARDNARTILGYNDIRFLRSNFFSHLQRQKFALIASNPPYVKSARFQTLQPEIRDWEPRLALDGGPDGLAAYRGILEEGWKHLDKDGNMLLEVDPEVMDGLRMILDEGSFCTESVECVFREEGQNDIRGDSRNFECKGQDSIAGGAHGSRGKGRYRIEGIMEDLTGAERLLILSAA